MKIEVGKLYKTRDGRMAKIYAVDGEENFPIHGAVLLLQGWKSYSWRSDGSLIKNSDGTHPWDIVSEWEEPKPKLKAWIHKDIGYINFAMKSTSEFGSNYMRAPWLDEPEDE